MARIFYDKDADLGLLKGKTIGVLGYGAQGHAHAQNLRDSGLEVLVADLKGTAGWKAAEAAGFKVVTPAEVAKAAQVIIMLVPDTVQREVYEQSLKESLKKGQTLMFAHGFNIHFNQIVPPPTVDVSMVAPKAPGRMVRQLYQQGVGTPALVAVHQDASGKARDIALAYAKGIGCTRAGVLETSFAEETETDLFGEQVVLCGGVSSLIKAAFETLVEAGYQPELAYFECCHELKLIVDLIYQGGLTHMRASVSDTAEFGDYISGPRIINEEVRWEMRQVLQEIQDGSFAHRWISEKQTGYPSFSLLRRREREHLIEDVGQELRAMMPWLQGPAQAQWVKISQRAKELGVPAAVLRRAARLGRIQSQRKGRLFLVAADATVKYRGRGKTRRPGKAQA